MDEYAYVYILASKYRRLYTGVTSMLETRVRQHKEKFHPESFTARYNIDQLVYFERFTSMSSAIAREKEIKGWLRIRKIALIVGANPTWRDLSEDWGQPVEPFDEGKVRPPNSFCGRDQDTEVLRSAQDDME